MMQMTHNNTFVTGGRYALAVDQTANSLSVKAYSISDTAAPGSIPGSDVASAWAGVYVTLQSSIAITLAEAAAMPMWSDHSVWSGNGAYPVSIGMQSLVQFRLWRNLTADSFVSKAPLGRGILGETLNSFVGVTPFFLMVPLKVSNFDECLLHSLVADASAPNLLNGSPVSTQALAVDAGAVIFPHLSITGPAQITAGGTADLSIQLLTAGGAALARNCTVYLENVGGYMPKTRVDLVNGVGSIRVSALQMLVGETVRVKAGWKFFTGETELIMTVVA